MSQVIMKLFLPISFKGSFNSQKSLLFKFIYDLRLLIIGIFYYFLLDSYTVDHTVVYA